VQRKLDKWKARAKAHSLELVDAAGVSPLCEMMYFWNSFKRMGPEQLELTLTRLDWSIENAKVPWASDSVDEKAMWATLRGTVLRHLGRTEEARAMLKDHVTSLDRATLKGGLKDDWTSPSAHYETGVTYWVDYQATGDTSNLEKSREWLDIASAWEAYDLDAR
jgi:hypothetical protein